MVLGKKGCKRDLKHRTFDKRLILPGVLILLSVLTAIGGPEIGFWCRYERSAILAGQWWRLLTAPVVHLGWIHMLLNVTGLMLVFSLFWERVSISTWLIGVIGCSLGTSIGLLIFSPNVDWCVGMSGMLHGLLALGIIASLDKDRWLACIAGLLLLAKLLSELTCGPMPSTEKIIGNAVVTEAHLYGIISGVTISMIRKLVAN